jgi:hypothetical protein
VASRSEVLGNGTVGGQEALQPCSETSDMGGSHRRFHQPQAKSRRVVAQGGNLPLRGPLFIVCSAEVATRDPMPKQVV